MNSGILSSKQLLCYGFLTAPLAMAGFALVFFVPTYYATEMGLGLGLVGVIFALGRILDVVTDPLIGHLSDRTAHRWGARLPWMVWGLPGFALATWLLLVPMEGAGVAYLILVSAAFYLFYTIVDVPYSSIGLEISPDVHERSKLAGFKAAFQVVGAILASLIPVALASKMGLSLQAIAASAIITAVIGLWLFWQFVPRTQRQVSLPRIGLVEGYRFILGHPRFRHLVIVFFIVQAANALTAGLIVLHAGHVIGAAHLIGTFFLIMFVSTAVFLPLWIWLSKWSSKRVSWAAAIALCCCALALAATLGAGDTTQMLIVCALLGASFGCDAIMPTSMLADIVYEGEAAGDHRRGGAFLAIKNALSKLTFVIPMALAFPVLDMVGFNKSGANDEVALNTLILFFAGVPIALRVIAASVLFLAAPREKVMNDPSGVPS